MKRWVLVTAVLTIAVLAAAPPAAHAQAKDTLVVALVSHALTLDPHMHFERVGILELLKELVPRLSRLAVLGDPEINVSRFHATELVQWESPWESCRNVGNGLVPGTG